MGQELLLMLGQFTGHHFGGHMRFVHRLVRQHGLADHVANGEDVRYVGAHLDVDVDEAAVCDGRTGLVGSHLFANAADRPSPCCHRPPCVVQCVLNLQF